jgi:hypothetical protein
MTQYLFLAFVFVTSATIGSNYVFRPDRVQASMVHICSKHKLLEDLMGQWLTDSIYCIPTLRLMGVLGYVVAAVAFLALLGQLD